MAIQNIRIIHGFCGIATISSLRENLQGFSWQSIKLKSLDSAKPLESFVIMQNLFLDNPAILQKT